MGEEATPPSLPGGAARTLWRRVEWGPGPSRRGADGLAVRCVRALALRCWRTHFVVFFGERSPVAGHFAAATTRRHVFRPGVTKFSA